MEQPKRTKLFPHKERQKREDDFKRQEAKIKAEGGEPIYFEFDSGAKIIIGVNKK